MKVINKWTLGATLFVVLAAMIVLALSGNGAVGQRRAWPFGAHPVRMWLLSNQEIAGLNFACFVLSNRTHDPVRYLQDRKSREPSYLLLERSAPDPVTRVVAITNHNQSRMVYMTPAELPPHSSVTFTVRYPSDVTNGVLSVNYWPSRTRLQLFLYSLSQRLFGRPTLPTNAYERITLDQPFGQ